MSGKRVEQPRIGLFFKKGLVIRMKYKYDNNSPQSSDALLDVYTYVL